MKHILTFKLFEQLEISKYKLDKRWNKKRDAIKKLQENITSLRRKLSSDMGSDDEKTMIIATIIKIIDNTGERVGNENSMDVGHYGISHLMKKHIKIDGDKVTLKYVGKSAVEHDVTFRDSKVASNLKQLLKHNDGEVFVTSEGLSIKAPQVNRYLEEFNITSKDLRGFKVNKLMSEALRGIKRPSDEKELKKIFNDELKKVAEKIGHTSGICRKNYLLPEIEKAWFSGKMVQKI